MQIHSTAGVLPHPCPGLATLASSALGVGPHSVPLAEHVRRAAFSALRLRKGTFFQLRISFTQYCLCNMIVIPSVPTLQFYVWWICVTCSSILRRRHSRVKVSPRAFCNGPGVLSCYRIRLCNGLLCRVLRRPRCSHVTALDLAKACYVANKSYGLRYGQHSIFLQMMVAM